MVKQRLNHINLGDIPKKRNGEGRLICLNCDKLLKGRQEKYCGADCSNEWMCKHDQGFMRTKMIKKKKGICNKCGISPRRKLNESYYDMEYINKRYKILGREKDKDGHCYVIVDSSDSSQLILDHIKPIALGGEEFDEDNLQILCKACDKIKTRQDHKDIAKLRRKEKLEAKGQTQLKEDGFPPITKVMGIQPTIL